MNGEDGWKMMGRAMGLGGLQSVLTREFTGSFVPVAYIGRLY